MRSLISFVFVFSVVLTFGGCGYKPGAKFARSVTGEKVSTSVVISQVDPENTVIIKDAVDAAILQIFHASLSDRAHSDSHLDISMSEPSYAPIQYNNDGYVVGYRARVVLRITRSTAKVVKRYNTTGTYDFAVEPNAIITDQERFIAIKNAASKAIVSFIAQVSAEGSSKN